jgi:hypothetical protein
MPTLGLARRSKIVFDLLTRWRMEKNFRGLYHLSQPLERVSLCMKMGRGQLEELLIGKSTTGP